LELSKFEPMEFMYVELMELEELREHVMKIMKEDQALIKMSFEKKVKAIIFQEGYLVLKWDTDRENLGKHSKFDAIWSGPYMIMGCKGSSDFQLSKLDGKEFLIL
ncbi:hypothetical protein KI387_004053, partial [Taxus chinensis]